MSNLLRTGVACCAVLTVSACGGGTAAPTTSAARSAAAIGPAPRQWIQRFCGKVLLGAAVDIKLMKDAVPPEGEIDVRLLKATRGILDAAVRPGLEVVVARETKRLTAATATGADATARTYLLNVYGTLHRSLAAAEARINALPTTRLQRFNSEAPDIVDSVVSAVQAGKDAITADGTLGPIYSATPSCR